MELHQRLKLVNDEESFLAFARELQLDRVAAAATESNSNRPEPRSWESRTIEAFLESALSWAEDTHFGASQGIPASNLWQKFAVFLYCGKIYE